MSAWQTFLDEIFPDKEDQEAMRRMMGYALVSPMVEDSASAQGSEASGEA